MRVHANILAYNGTAAGTNRDIPGSRQSSKGKTKSAGTNFVAAQKCVENVFTTANELSERDVIATGLDLREWNRCCTTVKRACKP